MTISVNTMRAIDHWVGVPLCAIASPLVALMDTVKNIFSRTPEVPKKLLFIELSEMGSAILVDPAMRNAQARGAELFFLIFKSNRASLTLLNTVKPENIFTIDSSSLVGLIKDTLRFLIIARRHRIDTVIDLELFSRFTALLTGLCGARHRVGYHRQGRRGNAGSLRSHYQNSGSMAPIGRRAQTERRRPYRHVS